MSIFTKCTCALLHVVQLTIIASYHAGLPMLFNIGKCWKAGLGYEARRSTDKTTSSRTLSSLPTKHIYDDGCDMSQSFPLVLLWEVFPLIHVELP